LPSRTSLVSKMNIVLLLVGLFAAIDSRAEARTWFAAGNAIEMADAKRGLTISTSGVEQEDCLDIAKTCSMFADGDICANEKASNWLAMKTRNENNAAAEREKRNGHPQSYFGLAFTQQKRIEVSVELAMCTGPELCYHLLRALLTPAFGKHICTASAEAEAVHISTYMSGRRP